MSDQTLKVFGRFYKKFRDMLDGTHAEVVAVGHSELPAGAATEATLVTRASEVTLADLRARLAALATAFNGRDLATETTQLTRATEYTLSEAVGLLTAIEGYLLAGIPVEGIAGGEPVTVTDSQRAALLALLVGGTLRAGLVAGTESVGGVKDNGPQWAVSRKYVASADATGVVDITDAPAAGQKIVLDDFIFSTDTTMNVTIQMETTGNVLAKFFVTAYTPMQISPRDLLKGDAADKKLQLDASVAGNIAVTTCWHSEA